MGEYKHKVLVVDDEVEILKALNRGLHREPYEKIFVDSGAQALDVFVENEISVIITDMRMPGMNGLELLEMVSDISPSTIKIVLTGYTKLPQILATVNRVDVYKFLTKPWDLENELKVFIREAIDLFEERKTVDDKLESKDQKNKVYQKMLTDGYEKVDYFMHLYEELMKTLNYHHLMTIEEFRQINKKVGESVDLTPLDEALKHLNTRMNFINKVFDYSKYSLKYFGIKDLAKAIEKHLSYKYHVEVTINDGDETTYYDNIKQLMGVITEIVDIPLIAGLEITHLMIRSEYTKGDHLVLFKMSSQSTPEIEHSLSENSAFLKMIVNSIGGVCDFYFNESELDVTVATKMRIKVDEKLLNESDS